MLEFTMTFSEMRDTWIAGYRDRDFSAFRLPHNASVFRDQCSGYRGSWHGSSGAEMLEYFREGFTVPGLDDISADATPVRKRARPRYNDCEGDFRYDLFMTGDENHFVQWSERESIPGITVEFGTGFRGHFSASAIAEYMAWICSALIAIEASGIDASIYATCKGFSRFERNANRRSFRETPAPDLKWRLEVKREGERNDFQSWSALFSPGSYRILGFFTNSLASDRLGEKVSSSMGGSVSDGWGVRWNSERRILEISHNAGDHNNEDFPAEMMTEQLKIALESAKN
jgi:hypothetical protein